MQPANGGANTNRKLARPVDVPVKLKDLLDRGVDVPVLADERIAAGLFSCQLDRLTG
jgi:hypothetical protein